MKKNSAIPKNTAALSCPDMSNHKRKPTKLECVLSHLIKYGNISPRDAMDLYQCWRLSAVVHTLKKAGITVRAEQEPHEGGIHARYFLDSGSKSAAENHFERLTRKEVKRYAVV
jgi:hypothetical protein